MFSHVLAELFVQTAGLPITSGPTMAAEFTAKAVRDWLSQPRCEDPLHRARQPLGERLQRKSFNGKLRDELLNGERSSTHSGRPRC